MSGVVVHPQQKHGEIAAVDLFCGIGGLTHGLQLAGVAVKAGLDIDSSCQYAFESNNAGAEFVHRDVQFINFKEIEHYYKDADITALVGCAPCQPFSGHNRCKPKADANCSLIEKFAQLVKEGKPDFVSMENVPGLQKQRIFTDFVETLDALGYATSHAVVRCELHGVPQKRPRLVLLASRLGRISMPQQTALPVTVGDCIRNLPPVAEGSSHPCDSAHVALPLSSLNRKRIVQSRPGGSWKDWDDDLVNDCHRKTMYLGPYGRMSWDELAPTITTQFCYYSAGRFGHPEQNRAISVREGALLQTFPGGYSLLDEKNPASVCQLSRHIGNAVPVMLGRAIGLSLLEAANEQWRIWPPRSRHVEHCMAI